MISDFIITLGGVNRAEIAHDLCDLMNAVEVRHEKGSQWWDIQLLNHELNTYLDKIIIYSYDDDLKIELKNTEFSSIHITRKGD